MDIDAVVPYVVGVAFLLAPGYFWWQTPEIESNVRFGGFKVFRTPSIPRELRIRYDESDPSRYSIMHVFSPVLRSVVSMACVAVGLFIIVGALARDV